MLCLPRDYEHMVVGGGGSKATSRPSVSHFKRQKRKWFGQFPVFCEMTISKTSFPHEIAPIFPSLPLKGRDDTIHLFPLPKFIFGVNLEFNMHLFLFAWLEIWKPDTKAISFLTRSKKMLKFWRTLCFCKIISVS